MFFNRQSPRKDFAEGFCGSVRGRIRGRIPEGPRRIPEGSRKDSGRIRKDSGPTHQANKLIPEGSADGFCGRLRGRILRKDPGRIRGRKSAEGKKVVIEVDHNILMALFLWPESSYKSPKCIHKSPDSPNSGHAICYVVIEGYPL